MRGACVLALFICLCGGVAADSIESRWDPLTEADVDRVVTTLDAMVERAQSAGTARKPPGIEFDGTAAVVLWAAESAVAAIDDVGVNGSDTLTQLLREQGYPPGGYELAAWRHVARRVLDVHDALRRGYFERDLGREWQALYREVGDSKDRAQWQRLAKIDAAARMVFRSSRDRRSVESHHDQLEHLRQAIASWPASE